MAAIAPWLNPPDYLSAIRAGAGLGLQLRNQALSEQQAEQRAQEAADSLRLHYAQLAGQTANEQALREQAKQTAAESLRMHQADILHKNALEGHQLAQEKQAAENAFASQNKPTATAQDMQLAGQLKSDATRLRNEGNIPEAQKLEYQLSLIEGKLLGPTETIETTTPEGVTSRIIRGKPAGTATDLTTATKTKLQEQMQSQEAPMAAISHIQRNMQASDFGLAGQLGSFMDRYVAQIKPEAADPRRMTVQNSVRTLRADFVKALKSDSQIAEPERKAIEKAIPSVDTIAQSAPLAMQMLVDAKQRFVAANRNAAKRLGTAPAPWAMSLDELKAAYGAKQISEAEAVDAVQKYFPETLK